MVNPLAWQLAELRAIRDETPETKSFTFDLPSWMPHLAGQHYDIRLTADDGYEAERSYSVASPPERIGEIELTVERIDDGEVSPFLHDVARVGDRIELRGPIGGYFVWRASEGGPLLLVAGGSGIVPLMAMLRHRNAAGSTVPTVLVYSSRTRELMIYADELDDLVAGGDGLTVVQTLTRSQPPGWSGYTRRIDRDLLAEVLPRVGEHARAYVCGPTLLVEAAADALVGLGLVSSQVRTERFGPTGR